MSKRPKLCRNDSLFGVFLCRSVSSVSKWHCVEIALCRNDWHPKLILCEKTKLSVAMYRILYSKHVINITMSKWLTSRKQTLDNCGYSYMWLQQDVNIDKFSLIVQRSLQDQYRQDWNNIVSISSKCDLY